MKSLLTINLFLMWWSLNAHAQLIYSPQELPRPISIGPNSVFSQTEVDLSALAGKLANRINLRLGELSTLPEQACSSPQAVDYIRKLSMQGRYDECLQFAESCSDRAAVVLLGARCGFLERRFESSYNLLQQALTQSHFSDSEHASLVLELAGQSRHGLYPDRTDAILETHSSWSPRDRLYLKSMIELLGGRRPQDVSAAEVLSYLDTLLQAESPLFSDTLRSYRLILLYNENRISDALMRLSNEHNSILQPIDWWPTAFKLLYVSVDNAEFSSPNLVYQAFLPFAHSRSYLPLEQNIYNYTQIFGNICRDRSSQGKAEEELRRSLLQWKGGSLSLSAAIGRLENLNNSESDKTDILSALGGLWAIKGEYERARNFYWQAHRVCPYNNRAHWGLALLNRKERFAAFPDYDENIRTAERIAQSIAFRPEDTEYFLNWKSLPASAHLRIIYDARIFIPYLSQLLRSSYSAYIKPPFELLSAAPQSESVRDRRIGPPDMPSYKFDNRLWDDVRGLGGAVVIADYEETFETAQGDFNLLAHEMTHQFHHHLAQQRPELGRCVARLFQAAKKRGEFADSYSSTNEQEYFAQGVVYYLISEDAPVRFGTNRSWFKQHDPALIEFIASIDESQGDMARIRCPN